MKYDTFPENCKIPFHIATFDTIRYKTRRNAFRILFVKIQKRLSKNIITYYKQFLNFEKI